MSYIFKKVQSAVYFRLRFIVNHFRGGYKGRLSVDILLSEIAEKTKNKSLETNISLALNNIKLGATIALKM